MRRSLAEAGVRPGARLLVGVSGGPDSTALLSVLVSLAPELNLSLVACIVDHGIRPPADTAADVAFARELCARWGIPLEVRQIPHGDLEREARRSGRSLEEVARRRRLSLLSEAGTATRADGIVLGHTRDDLLETVLMRFLQGAGPRGLAGIGPRRGRLLRPLLRASRADVLAWLAAEALPFRRDRSNSDPRFLRVRVRSVAALLDQVLPGWRQGVGSLARGMERLAGWLDAEAARMPWHAAGGGFAVDRVTFFAAPPALRLHALQLLADRMRHRVAEPRLPARFLEPALGPDPAAPRAVLLHGHGLVLTLDRAWVRWEADIASAREKGYLVEVRRDGWYALEAAGAVAEVRRAAEPAPGALAIAARSLVPPLVIRSRRTGDPMLSRGRAVPVKALLDRWSIGGRDRRRVVVLADRAGVVAVVAPGGGGAAGAAAAAELTAAAVRDGAAPKDAGEQLLLVRFVSGREQAAVQPSAGEGLT